MVFFACVELSYRFVRLLCVVACYTYCMKIAMIGQKSLVLGRRSGGVERHVAEVGKYLAAAGHDVTAYARKKYSPNLPSEVEGVRMRYLPTVYRKN